MDSLEPLYLGPHPMGGHRVQLPDGSMLQVSASALTPKLKLQAMRHFAVGGVVDQPQDPNGGPALFQMGSQGLQDVHNAMNSVPVGPLQPQAVASATGAPITMDQLPGDSAPAQSAPEADTPAPKRAVPLPDMPTGQPMAMGGGGGGGGGSAVSELEQGKAAGIKAAQQQAQVSTDIGKGQADVQAKAIAAQNAEAAKYQQQRDQDRQTGLDMLAKAQAVTDEARNAKLEGPQKTSLLSGLALIFGGGAAGFQGQANPVAKQLADRQQADLDRQKYNMEHGLKVADAYRNLYSDYRNVGLDDRSAHELTANTMKDQLANQLTQVTQQHAGPQAAAVMNKAISDQLGDTATKHQQILTGAAQAFQARAAGTHDLAEANALGQQGANNQLAKSAQDYLGSGGDWQTLQAQRPAMANALLAQAAQNKHLIPGVGITTTEVTDDNNKQLRGISAASKITNDLDNLVGGRISGEGKQIQSQGLAEGLTTTLPEALGASARLSPAIEEALKNLVPSNPGSVTTFWKDHGDAIKQILADHEQSLHENLGTRFFKPRPKFTKNG